jgi:prepilin-type N-terminal cleavage/methylation domain-containing protein
VKRSEAGFTLVEVLIAVMVLGVGITALAGSSAMVTRMISRGQMSTRAAQVASQRLEMLRLLAYSTTPYCTSGQFANGNTTNNPLKVNESWAIVANGTVRNISVTVTYAAARGKTVTNTLTTSIKC